KTLSFGWILNILLAILHLSFQLFLIRHLRLFHPNIASLPVQTRDTSSNLFPISYHRAIHCVRPSAGSSNSRIAQARTHLAKRSLVHLFPAHIARFAL